MKILDKKQFVMGPIHVNPGDTLIVSWDGVERMRVTIKEKQILDTAVLAEYSEEAKELGFEEALGCFVGESE